jgi:hypothetical protein
VKDALSITSHENVVTNPPYNRCEELIEHWLRTTSGKVALLLRLNWLEGQGRYEKFKLSRPYRVVVVVNRMRVFGKTSQFPHAWFIWDCSKRNRKTELIWEWAREI